MNDFLAATESLSKIIALLSAAIAAFGLLFQYSLKIKEERRLRDLATLEMDVKISGLFSELVSIANGYAGWSEPQSNVITEVLQTIPPEVKQMLLLRDPRSMGNLLSSSRVPKSVPLSQQLAASESLANLAIRYEFLKEPALVGLDVVAGFLPVAKSPYQRLCQHYGIERPLTDWDFGNPGSVRPDTEQNHNNA